MSEVNLEQVVQTVRGFTGVKLPNPEDLKEEIFVARLLSKVSDFIAHEKDEALNADSFLERLDAFAKAVPAVSFDGGTAKQRRVLLSECAAEENILHLTACQLKTIADDLKSQFLGSSQKIFDGGLPDPEDISLSLEEESGPKESGPAKETGDKPLPPPAPPLTWRDSIELRPEDDFNQEPESDAWKSSVNTPEGYDTGAGNAWQESLSDFSISDFDIARSAASEFDDLTSGDIYGYKKSLQQKMVEAEQHLQNVLRMTEIFEEKRKELL